MTQNAHFNMVEQQIRPWNVHSAQVIAAITELDRSKFVPEDQQALCYADTAISLSDDQKMLEPKVAARLVQALDLQAGDSVLQIGAGAGYTAALCATLVFSVDCVDVHPVALEQAAKNTATAGLDNINFQSVDQPQEILGFAEYDAILIRETGIISPEEAICLLAAGGRCVALVGADYISEMMLYTRSGKQIKSESLLDIILPENKATPTKNEFVF